jgi:glyoxylase-like metal-dependent hydrolase (beta-lactamase superfamily II)
VKAVGDAEIIAEGVYLIGGPNISRSDDATVFIIDFDGELVMIDAGAGGSSRILQQNMVSQGLDPKAISQLILTHCHIDHIGSAPWFRDQFGCRIVMHDLDADAVEQGDPVMTAANWYETTFPPTPVDRRLTGDHEILRFGEQELHCLHTPGHTPGSIAVYLDRAGKRILFGQDIHGPFMSAFRSSIEDWKKSMERLIALQADILCEGHFGIFQPRNKVEQYIRGYMRQYG